MVKNMFFVLRFVYVSKSLFFDFTEHKLFFIEECLIKRYCVIVRRLHPNATLGEVH